MARSLDPIRRIKASVRARDGFRCTQCGTTNDEHKEKTGRQLDVHRVVPGSAYSAESGVCVTLCRPCHGPQPRRRRGSRNIVKISGDIWRMARTIAADRGVRTTAFINSVLEPLIDAAYIEMARRILREAGE